MSVFFSLDPTPNDPRLAQLWRLLENEHFEDAMALAENVCQDNNAPIEFFCGLSLAYGECGYYADAERVARTVVGFGETNWRARHALATSLMHQGRYLAALDSLGFYRTPTEIYVLRAQVENMGGYIDSLQATLENALNTECPPPIYLYLAFLYGTLADNVRDWPDPDQAFEEVARYGDYLAVWERDAVRHRGTPYGDLLGEHVAAIRQIIRR